MGATSSELFHNEDVAWLVFDSEGPSDTADARILARDREEAQERYIDAAEAAGRVTGMLLVFRA